jgi:hypothetical protein
MAPNPFLSTVGKLVAEEMRLLGFIKRGPFLFVLKLNEEFDGWMGCTVSRESGAVILHSNVGVVCARLESMVNVLENRKPSQWSPTVILPLYTLMPGGQYVDWIFEFGEDCLALAHDLAHKVRDYALPVMNSLATMEALRALAMREVTPGQRTGSMMNQENKLICILHFLGRDVEARKFIDARLAHLRKDGHPADLERLERSARRFYDVTLRRPA